MKVYDKPSLLIKYLISYILILIFPLLIIFIYFYPLIIESTTNRIMNNNLRLTEGVKNSMDVQLKNINSITVEIHSNERLTPYALGKSVYAGVLGNQELKKCAAVNSFINNVFLYVKSRKTLYSPNGSFNTDDYDKWYNSYEYTYMTKNQFYDLLNTMKNPVVRASEPAKLPDSAANEVVTFFSPLPVGSDSPYGVVIITVSKSSFVSLIRSYIKDVNNTVYIFDSTGKAVFSTGNISDADQKNITDSIKDIRENQSGIIKIGEEEYIASYIKSDKNMWSYLSVVKLSDSLTDIQRIRTNTVLLIGLIIFIEMIIIYISLKSNYNPIKSLIRHAVRSITALDAKKSGGLDVVHYALDNLTIKSNELDEKIRSNKPAVKDYLLRALIYGRIKSINEFNRQGEEVDVYLKYPTYLVSVIYLIQENGRLDYNEIRDYFENIEKNLPVELQGYFLFDLSKENLIFLSSQEDETFIKSFLNYIQNELYSRKGIQTLIGIGKPAYEAEEIYNSYLHALSAVEFLQSNDVGKILGFGDLTDNMLKTGNYPGDSINNLKIAVLKSDIDSIRSSIDEITGIIINKSTPVNVVRLINSNTMAVLINSMLKYRDEGNEVDIRELSGYIMSSVYTVPQIVENISRSTEQLIGMVQLSKTTGAVYSIDQIIKYIEEHFMEYDFSIQSVSSHFDMSYSNLSHYFKKHANYNFKQFVDYVRINKAKELLENTDKSLETIALEIGYGNASSFVRTFRRILNLTPGDYRKSKTGR